MNSRVKSRVKSQVKGNGKTSENVAAGPNVKVGDSPATSEMFETQPVEAEKEKMQGGKWSTHRSPPMSITPLSNPLRRQALYPVSSDLQFASTTNPPAPP